MLVGCGETARLSRSLALDETVAVRVSSPEALAVFSMPLGLVTGDLDLDWAWMSKALLVTAAPAAVRDSPWAFSTPAASAAAAEAPRTSITRSGWSVSLSAKAGVWTARTPSTNSGLPRAISAA